MSQASNPDGIAASTSLPDHRLITDHHQAESSPSLIILKSNHPQTYCWHPSKMLTRSSNFTAVNPRSKLPGYRPVEQCSRFGSPEC